MAKKAKELSALAVSKLKEPGRYAVGGVDGLHIRIVGDSKAWVLRIKIGDRRCDIGLGPYPEVGLGDAREVERQARLHCSAVQLDGCERHCRPSGDLPETVRNFHRHAEQGRTGR